MNTDKFSEDQRVLHLRKSARKIFRAFHADGRRLKGNADEHRAEEISEDQRVFEFAEISEDQRVFEFAEISEKDGRRLREPQMNTDKFSEEPRAFNLRKSARKIFRAFHAGGRKLRETGIECKAQASQQ